MGCSRPLCRGSSRTKKRALKCERRSHVEGAGHSAYVRGHRRATAMLTKARWSPRVRVGRAVRLRSHSRWQNEKCVHIFTRSAWRMASKSLS